MQRRAIEEREQLEVLQPELGYPKPRVYYKNLHLINKCFVGGSVVAEVDGVEECVEGAEVVVTKGGDEVGQATTDTFGEFKIDRLEPGSGSYEVRVSGSAGSVSTSFELANDSVYLGTLNLV